MTLDDLILVIAALGFLAGFVTGWTLALVRDSGAGGGIE